MASETFNPDLPERLDPEELGFMCGIEVHQQLATGKLHSRQEGVLFDVTADAIPKDWPSVQRRLRAASGEGGQMDVAAKFESRRNRRFVYYQSPNAGLIELDDQPPKPHDGEAMQIALTVSAMMNCRPVGLMQAMRKTVVDGSNTSGFQRTTLVATDGKLNTKTGAVGIDVLCLEEDSARKITSELTDDGEIVYWNLDRLGIPLIEIATAPDIQSPEHAKETAEALGRTLRDTRSVRRGLGSIRQDLNVSIRCGDRVEIKGCQDLDWIPKIIELEMIRQWHFFQLANHLRTIHQLPLLSNDRDVPSESVSSIVAEKLPLRLIDVSSIFSQSNSSMVQNGLKKGYVMLALPLPGFNGLIGKKTIGMHGAQNPRLGREFAGAAKLAGVAGVFHSDELPAYGIEAEEVESIVNAIDGIQAFVLCLAPEWQANLALESVHKRAIQAFERIPQEVRQVVVKRGAPEDGTTSPMRPLPGGARMYPETDIPVYSLSQQHWQDVTDNLPMSLDERMERMNAYQISQDQRIQLVNRELDDAFVLHVDNLPSKAWASMLLELNGEPNLMASALKAKEQGHVTKEGLQDLLDAFIGQNPSIERLADVAESLGLKPADASDLATVVEKVVSERLEFVKERGLGALGPLMGMVMKEFGGAADGKAVSQLLKSSIERNLK